MKQDFIAVARDFHSPLIRNEIWVNFGRTWPELFNMPEPYVGIYSREDSIDYVVDNKTWAAAKEAFQKRIQLNPSTLTEMIDLSERWGQEMNSFTEKARQQDLAKWTNDEMWKFYQEFARLQTRQYAVGILLPLIDIAGVSFLEDFLRKYLREHLSEKEYSEAFAVFTTPTQNSFALDQEEALLELMQNIFGVQEVRKIFEERKPAEIMVQLNEKYPDTAKLIREHSVKYGWVYYVYAGPAFNPNHFVQFIQDYLKKGIDSSAELKRRKDEQKHLLRTRTELLKKLKPSKNEKELIEAVSQFVWAKPRRKDYQSKSYFHMEVFFKELGRRARVSLRHARSLTQMQIREVLAGREIDQKIINEQYGKHYAFTTEAGTKIVVGDEADRLFALAKTEKVEVKNMSELRGSTAFGGKTKGRVKLINQPEDMQKMQDGDVLVSVATTPSIVPAMKQATAIISDEGGLTCHAAIVSRELRIPCVVGTKIATKVLKDGDMVEVDANEGVVKVIGEEKNSNVWFKNFSIDNLPSFQLVSAMIDFGMRYGHEALFGKKVPLYLSETIMQYVGDNLEGGYFKDESLKEVAEATNKFIYKNPKKIFANHKATYYWNDQYFAFSKQILESDLHKMSEERLSKIYLKLTILQEKAHMHAINTTWFVDSHGATFTNSLMKETEDIVAKAKSKLKPADVFTVLTTPPKNSLAIKEEIESLAIVGKIQKDRGAKKIFTNLKQYDLLPEQLPSSLKKAILSHYQKWRWMPFGYMGPAYGLDYYLSVWAGLVREGIKTDKLIKEKKTRPKEIGEKRTKLFKQLNVSSQMRQVYEIGADVAFLKGYRKDCVYFGFYAIDYLFNEIAKRLNISLADLHYHTHGEISSLLLGKIKFDKNEITKRKQRSLFYWNGDKTVVYSGKEAESFYKNQNFKEEKIEKGASSFKGTCACSGSAKGRVKIINKTEEMHKMEVGDVMVSHTTFPSLVPAMKKAAAIVTEDGGITCHAAIVARELKTPCVTGVKGATQVLKDGDLVEVDAGSGLVKKI